MYQGENRRWEWTVWTICSAEGHHNAGVVVFPCIHCPFFGFFCCPCLLWLDKSTAAALQLSKAVLIPLNLGVPLLYQVALNSLLFYKGGGVGENGELSGRETRCLCLIHAFPCLFFSLKSKLWLDAIFVECLYGRFQWLVLVVKSKCCLLGKRGEEVSVQCREGGTMRQSFWFK